MHAADASDTKSHRGGASVILVKPMLLVTASHVVAGNTARISFPALGDDKLYEARVAARSTAETESKDFAVLVVDKPPEAGVEALEIWLDQVDKETQHDVVGYARDLPSLAWGSGKLAGAAECAWRLRQTTFNGDSGGAAVSEGGLLVGIVLDGREGGAFSGGAMGQATILPLQCVRKTLLSALDQVAPANNTNVLDVERPILSQKLQPPPSSGWIDNINFARALRDLMANPTLLQKVRSRGAVDCPLFRSTIERKLGYGTASDLIKFAEGNLKKAGDALRRKGDELKSENAELTQRLYASAIESYDAFIAANAPGPFASLGISSPVSPDVTRAAIERAQTFTALVEINKDSATKYAAVGAAAQAVNATPQGPTRGLAYAILGNTAFKTGDYQTAIEAYSSASQNGFTANWVKNSYLEAFRRRDNVSQPTTASDFMALGSYSGLGNNKLMLLGTNRPM